MDSETNLPLSHRRKSGSATRQKQGIIGVRATEAERQEFVAAADAEGLTLSSYIRESLLIQVRQTRTRRRPRVDVAALAKMHAELRRVGNNLNQMTRAMNQGDTPMMREVQDMRAALLQTMQKVRAAMGFEA